MYYVVAKNLSGQWRILVCTPLNWYKLCNMLDAFNCEYQTVDFID